MGVRPDGTKELIAVVDGYRASVGQSGDTASRASGVTVSLPAGW
jgi:hypothetical protein